MYHSVFVFVRVNANLEELVLVDNLVVDLCDVLDTLHHLHGVTVRADIREPHQVAEQDGHLGERLGGNTEDNRMVTLGHDWGGNTKENRMVTLGKDWVEKKRTTGWLSWGKTARGREDREHRGKQNDHVEERFGGNTEDNRMVTLGKDWVEKKRTTGWLSWGKTARGREDREHRGKQNDHVGERWEERQGKNRRVNLGKDSGKTQGKNRMVTLGIDWGGNTGENRMVTLGHDWDGNRRKQDGYLGERLRGGREDREHRGK